MDSAEPVVGIVMGSDSDWPVMKAATEALAEFDVPFEVSVVSAHRTPQRMLDYAGSAASRGLRVIIAGAGGAAHLPGMVASATVLPVIGVPVPLKYLDGMDSLLSIVQMPAGIPVATVSIGGARNAGLFECRLRLRETLVFRVFRSKSGTCSGNSSRSAARPTAGRICRKASPSARRRSSGPVRSNARIAKIR